MKITRTREEARRRALRRAEVREIEERLARFVREQETEANERDCDDRVGPPGSGA